MIPIYRAFSETFDKYILGVPYFSDGRYYMLVDDCNKNNNIGSGSYPIDETTLAIHFPDMLDSQGNKIFASLQEDGKGGDIVESIYNDNIVAIWQGLPAFRFEYKRLESKYDREFNELLASEIKIIGIQQ